MKILKYTGLLMLMAWGAIAQAAAEAVEPGSHAVAPWRALQETARDIPRPLDSHPGNLFVEGEVVTIHIPVEILPALSGWRVLDDQLTEVEHGVFNKNPNVEIGQLPVGWYRVELMGDTDGAPVFTTVAVLAPLQAPVPQDSPICVDAALSWLSEENESDWQAYSRLAALAGVNWIRDRIHWREVESAPGEAIPDTKYDSVASIQHDDGMKVLQVFHTLPPYARIVDETAERVQPDLGQVHAFCASMAARFEQTVQAWEPWNEGNAGNFGGWTVDEMCSHQKAAYLGFKSANPEVTVCWSPIGGINTAAQAAGILNNETWPFYDVYTIHSYDWPHGYPELWAHARDAASGRPMWVTESDRGLKAATPLPWADLDHADGIRKAQFMAQSYATSLYSGAVRHFHFVLGHYTEQEGVIQFGLLRKDKTPRPSYVALAALGRLLAGGRCLGRYDSGVSADVHVYAFRARPDGEEKDVLVAWYEKEADWPNRGAASIDWEMPEDVQVDTAYDYLGREIGNTAPAALGSAPVFLVLPAGETDKLALETIAPSPWREGDPSPVVMQFSTPGLAPEIRRIGWTQEPLRAFEPDSETECVLTVYNFHETPVSGSIRIEDLPEGWHLSPESSTIQLESGARAALRLRLRTGPEPLLEDEWITIRGQFDGLEASVVAVQVASL